MTGSKLSLLTLRPNSRSLIHPQCRKIYTRCLRLISASGLHICREDLLRCRASHIVILLMDRTVTGKVFNELYRQFPRAACRIRRPWREAWPFTHATTGMYIQTKDKPIRTMDDLAGLRIVSLGFSEWLDKLGAIQQMLPELVVSPALDKGTIDGVVFFLPPSHM